jgi:hypothetical protein
MWPLEQYLNTGSSLPTTTTTTYSPLPIARGAFNPLLLQETHSRRRCRREPIQYASVCRSHRWKVQHLSSRDDSPFFFCRVVVSFTFLSLSLRPDQRSPLPHPPPSLVCDKSSRVVSHARTINKNTSLTTSFLSSPLLDSTRVEEEEEEPKVFSFFTLGKTLEKQTMVTTVTLSSAAAANRVRSNKRKVFT